MREWALWREPWLAVAYVAGVVALAATLAVSYALRTPLRPLELAIFGGLVACGLVCVEGTRRLGEPRIVARDLIFAWGLPVALLLPPLYAFLFPVPIALLTQLRVKRSPLHRRVFSTAARGLACAVASVVFTLSLSRIATATPAWVSQPEKVVALALACGALCIAMNEVLVGLVIRLSLPDARWRDVGWDLEAVKIDLVELSLGVLLAVGVVLAVPLVVLALPSVLLLQRSLVHAQLRAAARTDTKTGLLNAGTWEDEAKSEVTRATRTGGPLALLLIDIDHFKQVNDEHGHLLGDEVLLAVAGLLVNQLRDYDLLGRFGGEEFAVLLPDTGVAEAYRVAERLRTHAAMIAVPSGERQVTVTVSIGVALFGAHAVGLTGLIAAADLALYHAKLSGRNRVCPQANRGLSPEPPREAFDAPAPVTGEGERPPAESVPESGARKPVGPRSAAGA